MCWYYAHGEKFDPFASATHASPKDVLLVMIDGQAMYGDPAVMRTTRFAAIDTGRTGRVWSEEKYCVDEVSWECSDPFVRLKDSWMTPFAVGVRD